MGIQSICNIDIVEGAIDSGGVDGRLDAGSNF